MKRTKKKGSTKVTQAVSVADFKQYVPAKATVKMTQKIAVFLAELSQMSKPNEIESRCKGVLESLRSEGKAPSTLKGWISQYRGAAKAWAKATGNGSIAAIALEHLVESKEFYSGIRERDEQARSKKQQERTPIQPESILKALEQGLKSHDYRELAAWIELAIGLRLSEVLGKAEIRFHSNYEVIATGRLKGTKGKAKPTPTIAPAGLVLDAITRLRRFPEVYEMKDWAAAKIDSGKNSTVNRQIVAALNGLIAPPTGQKELSSHNLRAAYGAIAYHLFGKQAESFRSFVKRALAHDTDSAGAHYEGYYCADSNGDELKHGIWVKRLDGDELQPSIKPELLEVEADSDLIERIDNWGNGTQAQNLEDIICTAQLAAHYERRIEALQKQLVEAQAEVVAAPKQSRNDITDWTRAGDKELMQSKAPAAAVERVRRAVAAIQEHNAGLRFEEQWAITPTVVKKLSGVRQGTVSEWLELHKEEIEAANEGMGYHQNRGKGNPQDSIVWAGSVVGKAQAA